MLVARYNGFESFELKQEVNRRLMENTLFQGTALYTKEPTANLKWFYYYQPYQIIGDTLTILDKIDVTKV